MNMYTVNVFAKKGDPATLLNSIDWAFVDSPVKNMTHAPDCLLISSSEEKKDIGFCFKTEAEMTVWMTAVEMIKLCRKGIDPKAALKF